MSHSNKPVFFSACFGMLLFGISLITLGSLAPDLKAKFQLDEIAAGSLFSILPIGILMGSLIFGPIVDKYGYRFLLALSALALFAGFQGIAYSPSFTWIKISVFIFGIGGGAINGATNAVVADISTKNKAADLSILGVFFAIGALGMPFILGIMNKLFSFQRIVSAVGMLAFAAAVIFLSIRFPPPKIQKSIPISRSLGLVKDKVLLLIAFFLFCQSSMEGIINNWTTLYLMDGLPVNQSMALYALSLYVSGMAVMRILIGSVLRGFSSRKILIISFVLLISGSILLGLANTFPVALAGLILLGAGLAAGYPVMLGLVSDRYADLSGTAFSLVLALALLGNMSVNYLMGLIAGNFGIVYLPALALSIIMVMILLTKPILRNTIINPLNKDDYVSKRMAQ